MDPVIAFVGGGNMARSLIGGLIARGHPAQALRVAEPVQALRDALQADFGVPVFADGPGAVADADLWVLAVKPQVLRAVCAQLAPQAQARRPLLVSIAAGVRSAAIDAWLGGGQRIVRAMPNTPAQLGAGATGLYAGPAVDPAARALAAQLLAAAGICVWVEDEAQIDAVTALSGSGPAYVFLLAEAMFAAGVAEGLPEASARALTVQTLLGAARMLAETGEDAAALRHRVTSPGGTTQAAIETFEAGGLRTLVAAAIHAARVRGEQLAAAAG
ncbi:pyrroline-5-carboxylate reductase [Thermomonas flagellata]|uniref:pyrroline-5-carboxylate reductase n=1 Tax=Thermomonas flagellata TaxID=2888524 RepID=UPI001F03C27A|nr:pyrroline-5-carboxylate reductase [Thermomonas flagellata]